MVNTRSSRGTQVALRAADKAIDHFNATAERYLAAYASDGPAGYGLRVRQQCVLQLMESAGVKVLDVGCGPGVLAQALAHTGRQVWAIDAATGMIELAAEECRGQANIALSVGQATQLTFPSGSFDAVSCIGVIERIVPNSAAFAEMARVITKDGMLVISFPNALSPYVSWKKFIFYPLVNLIRSLMGRELIAVAPWKNVYTVGRIRRQLQRQGMRIQAVKYCNFNICLSPLDELLPRLAMRWSQRLERLSRGKFCWLGCVLIVQAVLNSQ